MRSTEKGRQRQKGLLSGLKGNEREERIVRDTGGIPVAFNQLMGTMAITIAKKHSEKEEAKIVTHVIEVVEGNDVSAQEAVQKVAPARQFLKHFRGRKRGVQEEAYRRPRKTPPEQRRSIVRSTNQRIGQTRKKSMRAQTKHSSQKYIERV